MGASRSSSSSAPSCALAHSPDVRRAGSALRGPRGQPASLELLSTTSPTSPPLPLPSLTPSSLDTMVRPLRPRRAQHQPRLTRATAPCLPHRPSSLPPSVRSSPLELASLSPRRSSPTGRSFPERQEGSPQGLSAHAPGPWPRGASRADAPLPPSDNPYRSGTRTASLGTVPSSACRVPSLLQRT